MEKILENTCGCFCKAPAAFQHKEYIRKRETHESNSSILSPKRSSCIGDTSPRSLALSLECCSAGAGDTLQRFSTLAIPCRHEGCICEAGVFEQFTHVTAPAPTCKSWGPFPSDLGLLLSGSSLNPPQTWGKKNQIRATVAVVSTRHVRHSGTNVNRFRPV